jgi:hypothetical protein
MLFFLLFFLTLTRKIIEKTLKKYYFNIFLRHKTLKKQKPSQLRTAVESVVDC